jgi:hypothetical protein
MAAHRREPALWSEFPALAPVIIFVAILILGAPVAEANYEHSKGSFFGPESMLDARLDKELIMSFRMVNATVQFQTGPVVEEMEQFVSNLVRMQTGAMSRADVGQINRTTLVADHHVDIAPGAFGLDCLFSAARIHGVQFSIFDC